MSFVSIIIPTHDRPEMLAEALASVRAQTFTDYEIVVVSNGEHHQQQRLSAAVAATFDARYFELETGNVSAARNFGIEKARGKWIAFLDDDDLWLPEKLERQIVEAKRNGADMVACDYVEFDGRGIKPDRILRPGKWGSPNVKTLSHMRWWAAPSAVIVRTDVVRFLNFDPSFPNHEDMDLWRRISWRHRIYHMDGAILSRLRRSHPSLTRHRVRALWYEGLYFRKMWRDTPSDLRWALPPKRTMATRIASSAVRIFLTDMWTGNPLFQALHRWWQPIRHTLRPRTRLIQLRYRLRLRTRAKAMADVAVQSIGASSKVIPH
jgi:glycosyltransferase involved in cell wall biosynthesis